MAASLPTTGDVKATAESNATAMAETLTVAVAAGLGVGVAGRRCQHNRRRDHRGVRRLRREMSTPPMRPMETSSWWRNSRARGQCDRASWCRLSARQCRGQQCDGNDAKHDPGLHQRFSHRAQFDRHSGSAEQHRQRRYDRRRRWFRRGHGADVNGYDETNSQLVRWLGR